jgi:hypothetical protein
MTMSMSTPSHKTAHLSWSSSTTDLPHQLEISRFLVFDHLDTAKWTAVVQAPPHKNPMWVQMIQSLDKRHRELHDAMSTLVVHPSRLFFSGSYAMCIDKLVGVGSYCCHLSLIIILSRPLLPLCNICQLCLCGLCLHSDSLQSH